MANATTTATETGKVRGVNLAKVKEALLDKSIKALDLRIKKGATIADKVNKLADHFDAREKADDEVGDCTNCGGMSTTNLDECPFCGDSEGGDDAVQIVRETPAAAPAPAAAAPVVTTTAAPAAAPAAPEGGKRKKKKNPDDPAVTGVAPATTTAPAAPAAVLVLTNDAPAATLGQVLTEKDLDAMVADVKAAMGDGTVAYHRLGTSLKRVFETQAYKQRMKDGKARYRSWEAFLAAEIGISHSSAFDAMQVAAKFTVDQVRAFGHSKLAITVRAPDEAQAGIVEKIAGGATAQQVREEVAAARKKHGKGGTSSVKKTTKRKTAKASAASTKKRAGKRTDKITVASILNKPQKVVFFTTASMKGDPNERKPMRAQMFKDTPIGSLALANDVGLHILLKKTKKGIEAVVNFKRTE